MSVLRLSAWICATLFLPFTFTARADESSATLKVKDDVYTNVTVTSSSATDIYFTHSRGLASAKLKDLAPELQKHFHYNASKGADVEAAQREATTNYRIALAQAKPTTVRHVEGQDDKSAGEDFVAPRISARSVRGQPVPTVEIEKWITDAPQTQGKFVLVDFWATWCGPCRQSIPELNAFAKKFSDRLVVIGISDEPEAAIRKMSNPHIDYAIASDTQQRMHRNLQITGIPHCILVDPSGIVRYEGHPGYLDADKLQHFLDKYSK